MSLYLNLVVLGLAGVVVGTQSAVWFLYHYSRRYPPERPVQWANALSYAAAMWMLLGAMYLVAMQPRSLTWATGFCFVAASLEGVSTCFAVAMMRLRGREVQDTKNELTGVIHDLMRREVEIEKERYQRRNGGAS